jgi:hypothetical protein
MEEVDVEVVAWSDESVTKGLSRCRGSRVVAGNSKLGLFRRGITLRNTMDVVAATDTHRVEGSLIGKLETRRRRA